MPTGELPTVADLRGLVFLPYDGRTHISNLEKALTQAHIDLETLRKKAERYEWLRDHWDEWTGLAWNEPVGPKLDEAIDDAMFAVRNVPGTLTTE